MYNPIQYNIISVSAFRRIGGDLIAKAVASLKEAVVASVKASVLASVVASIKTAALAVVSVLAVCIAFSSCGDGKQGNGGKEQEGGESLRRVLLVQSLYNYHPEEDIVPRMKAVVDSMRNDARDPYYFAATNVLIDRLFSDGRFAEADSLAVRMQEEAVEQHDSISMAMAKRVRAQMLYKLSQPAEAFRELLPAADYISDPFRNPSAFGTATSIREWLWIIARELDDTLSMNKAGISYAELVDKNKEINRREDPTHHHAVTALAFRARNSFSEGNHPEARAFLDSAKSLILPDLPSRAYEHYYSVSCLVRASESDWQGAIADTDTLLSTHRDFPWFYIRDLLLKAEILNQAGLHQESARAYSDYIEFHDSLSNKITESRLHDLTLLYRTEIDREQRRADRLRMFAFGAVILLLLALSIIALLHAAREKKRVRLLVERLKEFDRAAESASHLNREEDKEDMPLIDRLDRYMRNDRPYTDPALGRRELAEFAGISQEALGQLIKEEKGMSVRSYINSFRLEEARRVLGETADETIADIAVRLGFGTVRTLQRAFKERYDITAAQYREAAKEIGES